MTLDWREHQVVLVGRGRVGTLLQRVLHAAGTQAALVDAHQVVAGTLSPPAAAALSSAEVVLLTVPDDVIATVAEAISWRAGQLAIHTSGAAPRALLAPVIAAAGASAVLHPAQTITVGSPPSMLRGAAAGIEAEDAVYETVASLARWLGLVPYRLQPGQRPAWHAATVFASNYIITLAAEAQACLAQAGVPADRQSAVLQPLMRQAITNLASASPLASLTGPLARGDVATVAAHLGALPASSAELYRALGVATVRLAHDGGVVDARQAEQLRRVLGATPGGLP